MKLAMIISTISLIGSTVVAAPMPDLPGKDIIDSLPIGGARKALPLGGLLGGKKKGGGDGKGSDLPLQGDLLRGNGGKDGKGEENPTSQAVHPLTSNARPGGILPQTDNQLANILGSPLESTTGMLVKPKGVGKILQQVTGAL